MSEENSRIGDSNLKLLRQLSIPTWARMFAFIVAAVTLTGCIWLIGVGIFLHAHHGNDRLAELGATVLGSTFVPMILLVYIAFARTGTKALRIKVDDLLLNLLPSVFNGPVISWEDDPRAQLTSCLVIPSRTDRGRGWRCLWRRLTNRPCGMQSPSERFSLHVMWGGHSVIDLAFAVDFNITKVNVGLKIPRSGIHEEDQSLSHNVIVEKIFGATLEGAIHEGYSINEHVIVTDKYIEISGRLRLREDFMWDPAQQLHFAQDLRIFVLSYADNWCRYLFSNPTERVAEGVADSSAAV